jgi:hypothetical protein
VHVPEQQATDAEHAAPSCAHAVFWQMPPVHEPWQHVCPAAHDAPSGAQVIVLGWQVLFAVWLQNMP